MPTTTTRPSAARTSASAYATPAERWAAVLCRDRTADGRFFFAVRTTGVYCRPSCPARRPRRENAEFFAAPADAERAGYRACRRCRPDRAADGRMEEAIAGACRSLEHAGQSAVDSVSLAMRGGVGARAFALAFRAATGLTPRAYAAAARARRMREELSGEARSKTVTAAALRAGFNSGARFYATAPQALGMTPTAFRLGGAGERIRFALGRCSLGAILVAATDRGVCWISIGDAGAPLVAEFERRFARAERVPADRAFESTVARVIALVERPTAGVDLPLDVRGTAFQLRVWRALSAIPRGQTRTYAEVAREIGAPRAVRAVAGAVAANALAVAVPCHRVVRTDGQFTGYRWGVERKKRLLERERPDSK